MVSSSIENTNWLTELFQISPNATPINGTILTDISDDSGTIVFPMIASGTYHMTFTKLSEGISETKHIHPTQQFYVYILATTATATQANLADSVNINLTTRSIIPAVVHLIGNYTDTSALTSSVTFYVNFPNTTTLYTTTVAASNLNASYAVNNVAGDGYVWGMSGVRPGGTGFINKSAGITMKGTGTSGLANNLIKLGCTNWSCP